MVCALRRFGERPKSAEYTGHSFSTIQRGNVLAVRCVVPAQSAASSCLCFTATRQLETGTSAYPAPFLLPSPPYFAGRKFTGGPSAHHTCSHAQQIFMQPNYGTVPFRTESVDETPPLLF